MPRFEPFTRHTTTLTPQGSHTQEEGRDTHPAQGKTASVVWRLAQQVSRFARDALIVQFGKPSANFWSYRHNKSVTLSGTQNLQQKAERYGDAREMTLFGPFEKTNLEKLVLFPQLDELILAGEHWEDAHLCAVVNHPALRFVNICPMHSHHEQAFARSFRAPSLGYPRMNSDSAPMPQREYFESRQSRITDKGIEILANHYNLTGLNISRGSRLTDTSLRHLARATRLQSLQLSSPTRLSNEGLAYLKPIEDLRVLNLNSLTAYDLETQDGFFDNAFQGTISTSGIEALSSHKNLQSLSLANHVQLDNHDVELMASGFKWLRQLNLQGCYLISHNCISSLLKMQYLEYLNLTHTQITDESIKCLAQLPNLQHLNVSYCHRLTPRVLNHLTQIKHLRYLNIDCCDGLDTRVIERAISKKNVCVKFPDRDQDGTGGGC